MRHYILLLFIGFSVCLTSCRDDFEFEPGTGSLEFSKDTVYLDTVFTNIGSSTYTLKVYNRSNKNIMIPSLRLGQGDNSKYRLMVDGIPGRVFSNIELLAKDSMFVFIETTIDYSEYENDRTNFLYTDRIEFDSGANLQNVELVTLVQDAVFLYPQRSAEGVYETVPLSEEDPTPIYGFNLSHDEHGDEFIWTAEKPYVIYGLATVPAGETLTVQPGARVHFHADSGLMVRPGASLQAGNDNEGPTAENQIIFEGDRLEPGFSDVPGQWTTIWMREGSTASLNNLLIKNAVVGLLVEGNDGTDDTLRMHNVQLYNSANIGILSRNGHIYGQNVVINNAGEASLACTLGGKYLFRHCTFGNYFNAFNQVPVLLTDYQETPDAVLVSDFDAQFDNCILFGSGNYGFLLDNKGKEAEPPTLFRYKFNNCLIKFTDFGNQFANNAMYDFNNPELYSACTVAKTTSISPQFQDVQNNKLNIGPESRAKDIGNPKVSALVPADIMGATRGADGTPPDAGAYESAAFPE